MATTSQPLKLPRGIKNNNPGNIRHGTQTVWVGESKDQPDYSFIKFDSPDYGIRALMKILLVYYNEHGLKTIKDIIERYAPPTENDTASYIAIVTKLTGVGATDIISDITSMLVPIAKAISINENGYPEENLPPFWFPDEIYETAKQMATS